MRRAYTGYRESENQHLYNDFTEIEADELPKVGDEWRDGIVYAVNEEQLDCEQPNDDNFKFNYYYIEWIDGDGDDCGDDDIDDAPLVIGFGHSFSHECAFLLLARRPNIRGYMYAHDAYVRGHARVGSGTGR